jgi:hypothetical protein
MSKTLILVEGQTEETFVRDILAQYLETFSVCIIPKLLVTKRTKSGMQFKGGIRSYEQVRSDLRRLLSDSSASVVTTMLDYYGLPNDFPGYDTRPTSSDPYAKVNHIERAFAQDINDPRFVPYLSLHEYEALVFTDPACCNWIFEDAGVVRRLKAIRDSYKSPEHINDGRMTAPSKRIMSVFPTYQKPLHGPLATTAIGLDALRSACLHFCGWLSAMEKAGQE